MLWGHSISSGEGGLGGISSPRLVKGFSVLHSKAQQVFKGGGVSRATHRRQHDGWCSGNGAAASSGSDGSLGGLSSLHPSKGLGTCCTRWRSMVLRQR